ncbi:MAG: YraN family protein [Cucumibacter sp.]
MADRPVLTRRRAERFGRTGEAIAALWLIVSGHRIRAARVKTPVGEIDLIASRGRSLVFVEVKSRASVLERDLAFAAVNRSRISAAAAFWIGTHPRYAGWDMRFDVIGLAPMRLPRHVKGAFDATESRGRRWL